MNKTVNAREMLLNTCFLLILFSDWSAGSFCRFRGRWAGFLYTNILYCQSQARLKPKINLVGIIDTIKEEVFSLDYCYQISTTHRVSCKKVYLFSRVSREIWPQTTLCLWMSNIIKFKNIAFWSVFNWLGNLKYQFIISFSWEILK